MKAYIEKLLDIGVLSIIHEELTEIHYNVEDGYYLIVEPDYNDDGKFFIVDKIIHDYDAKIIECFDADNRVLKYPNADIFHACKILNI